VGEQEEEDVAQPDLGEDVLEREVRLRPVLRSQEDAERDQDEGAPDRMAELRGERLSPRAAAGHRERERHAHHEHERRLDQVPRNEAGPGDVIEPEGEPLCDAAVRELLRDARDPHDLRRHEQHRETAEHVERREPAGGLERRRRGRARRGDFPAPLEPRDSRLGEGHAASWADRVS
jgi:hypothetical protein